MAKNVIKFAEELPKNTKSIVVHCHAGISRSAAVAKFLAEEIYKDYFPEKYMLYNKLVYRTLINTWQKMKEEEFKKEVKGI